MSQPAPVTIWVPALPRFAPDHPLRRALRQADRLPDGQRGYLQGLAYYFSTGSRTLPAAALLRQHLAGDAGGATWLSADPAWVQAEMNGARLLACGQFGLAMDEAQALAALLRPVFCDAGMMLEVSAPDRWQVRLADGTPVPDFAAPEQALGEDLYQHLPQGEAGRRWRILINELQVLLHQHPLNAERRAKGLPPVNSLWLWGGGTLPASVTARVAGTIGDDPLLLALAAQAGVPATPRSMPAVADAAAGCLVDLQDLPVGEIERAWWPALQAVLARRPVQLDFASGERWLHKPLHRWRFWRR